MCLPSFLLEPGPPGQRRIRPKELRSGASSTSVFGPTMARDADAVPALTGPDGGEEHASVLPDVREGSSPGVADPVLGRGGSLLDRLQVRRARRQEPLAGTDLAGHPAHDLSLVAAEVVEDDRAAGLRGPGRAPPDPRLEGPLLDRPQDRPARAGMERTIAAGDANPETNVCRRDLLLQGSAGTRDNG